MCVYACRFYAERRPLSLVANAREAPEPTRKVVGMTESVNQSVSQLTLKQGATVVDSSSSSTHPVYTGYAKFETTPVHRLLLVR